MAGLIYSANFGSYDSPKAIKVREEGVEYVMFSDGERVPGWAMRDGPKGMTGSLMQARGVKVMRPYDQDYDWYLWLDATMQIQAPILPMIEKLLKSKHDFAAFKHNEWRCSYDEIRACIRRKKDSFENLDKAQQLLSEQKLPINFGQPATGVLWRRNTENVKSHALAWWTDMQATTLRDQATFMLNLWQKKIYIEWIPGLHTKNKWFDYQRGHRK